MTFFFFFNLKRPVEPGHCGWTHRESPTSDLSLINECEWFCREPFTLIVVESKLSVTFTLFFGINRKHHSWVYRPSPEDDKTADSHININSVCQLQFNDLLLNIRPIFPQWGKIKQYVQISCYCNVELTLEFREHSWINIYLIYEDTVNGKWSQFI